MLFQPIKYFFFLLKASNQHGVHSPFVYNLVTNCFYAKKDQIKWLKHKTIKQTLLKNENSIKVTDFGAGSRIFKDEDRKISKIAKIAGISNKKANLLLKITKYFKPNTILEMGTSLGLGTAALKLGAENAAITTLEGCPETAKIAEEMFLKNNFTHIKIINGDFKETLLPSIKNNKFDCFYFDGNHTKKATLNYFETCLNSIHNNSFFIFDDIYWNKEMLAAWEIIKKHKSVTVTVDVFYFGLVFFRKEQAKEHFKIRV
ncbi:class I SAM-dependent methyltransferase [uncultured Polaribacter sp.]|uniref:O-methyltransferase n=1 Tax=uncultured Polaribacter sp. TaxID=174711 RepID=UPI002613CF6F|nr:class I SAM-dependent methyltransferase [uncultured Polaribacter sp.]